MDVNNNVAQAALKAFKRHLWYLVPDLVPLALFDNNLQSEQKQLLANAILQQPKDVVYNSRFGEGFGKPIFPVLEDDTTLEELVGKDSWQFFTSLKIKSEFLTKPANEWSSLETYTEGKKIVDSLKVPNDTAERGVKLATDFHGAAKHEQCHQQILQVVENDRNHCKDQRKRQKFDHPTSWFLILE